MAKGKGRSGSIIRARVDPIAQLLQEHDLALLQLTAFRRTVDDLVRKGFDKESFRALRNSIRYINEEVSVHNKSEEDALFPVLEKYVEGPTALMRKEHREMARDFRRLKRLVARLEKTPEDAEGGQQLRDLAETLIQRFVNHIHKENYLLFPLVQRFLTKEAMREVARRML